MHNGFMGPCPAGVLICVSKTIHIGLILYNHKNLLKLQKKIYLIPLKRV